jgi:hypothetical protein
MLEEDFIYFIDNQDYLANTYPDRYVLIKNKVVLGDFSTRNEAASHAIYELELHPGTYLIQKCVH